MSTNNEELFKKIFDKGSLKLDVYDLTLDVFKHFKAEVIEMVKKYDIAHKNEPNADRVPFTYQDKGDFEFEIKFGGDILLFIMHTNIFEIPRTHEVMSTSYIKKDKTRSYCGMINIYNFLADSFKYGREYDAGYLVGRIMLNKEKHYFIEGKQEIGMIYHHFENSVMDQEAIQQIISSAIEYTVNFDLLIPPYEKVSLISVMDMKRAIQGSSFVTGKRVGFKFQADIKEVKGQKKDSQ